MSALERLATALASTGDLRRNEPMSRHTTFGIGGPADLFVTVRDAEGLKGASRAAFELGVPVFTLGSGSNILVADAGVRGLVIDNRARAEAVADDGHTYRVETGGSFAAFARRMGRIGRAGLTWAVGIPGTLGGAVVYNAGAYGGCLADVLRRVRLDGGEIDDTWVDAADLGLVYRGSVFTRGIFAGKTVLEVEVRLLDGDPAELARTAAAYDTRRLAAQPRGRNAGSMFKNPAESPAWKLIDAAGMRGMQRGDAAISDKHCNFFVNLGNARGSDVAWLVEEAERRVADQFGVRLDREVAFVGGLVMAQQRVAVLLGGRSGEHEVSIRSARSVMGALDPERWEVVPLGITRRGDWLSPAETRSALHAGAHAFGETGMPLLGATSALAALSECEVALPLIHGTFGEDGTLQGFLELAEVPYAGCGVAASAIGMDKALMKALFREAGIRQARYSVARSWEVAADPAAAHAYIAETAGFPCFVKPANGGSSVGVTKVRSSEDLDAAFASAFTHDDKAVVEEAIAGQEVECSVLGNEHPEASVVGEIIPDREFYDYESKYSDESATELAIPARIDSGTAETVREMALRMYRVMGCEGYARVDFFVTAAGDVLANEVNTIPGFTSISMYPKLWEASGLSYRDLLSRILDLALARFERRSRL